MAWIMQKVTGIANLPEHGKFRVFLECGHSMLYDHTVDAVSEYHPNLDLICFECGSENEEY